MPSVNCGINLDLNCSKNCVIVATAAGDQDGPFSKTHTKLYVPVVTLSARDNSELLKQLKSGFNRTINWNKYQ